MTIAELIAKLQTLPPTATVYSYDDGDGGYGNVTRAPILNWCEEKQQLLLAVTEYGDIDVVWSAL